MDIIVNYRHKTIQEIFKISKQYNDNPDATFVLLRSCLHVIRNSMAIEDAIDFLTLLPSPFKTIFLENWKPSQNIATNLSKDQFVKEVKILSYKNNDFCKDEDISRKITIILNHLSMNLSTEKKYDFLRLTAPFIVLE